MVLEMWMAQHSLHCMQYSTLFWSQIVLECISVAAISISHFFWKVLIFFWLVGPLESLIWTIVSKMWLKGLFDFSKKKIWAHSMQGWTATTRHGVTRKSHKERLKHTGNLFRKNLQLKDVC